MSRRKKMHKANKSADFAMEERESSSSALFSREDVSGSAQNDPLLLQSSSSQELSPAGKRRGVHSRVFSDDFEYRCPAPMYEEETVKKHRRGKSVAPARRRFSVVNFNQNMNSEGDVVITNRNFAKRGHQRFESYQEAILENIVNAHPEGYVPYENLIGAIKEVDGEEILEQTEEEESEEPPWYDNMYVKMVIIDIYGVLGFFLFIFGLGDDLKNGPIPVYWSVVILIHMSITMALLASIILQRFYYLAHMCFYGILYLALVYGGLELFVEHPGYRQTFADTVINFPSALFVVPYMYVAAASYTLRDANDLRRIPKSKEDRGCKELLPLFSLAFAPIPSVAGVNVDFENAADSYAKSPSVCDSTCSAPHPYDNSTIVNMHQDLKTDKETQISFKTLSKLTFFYKGTIFKYNFLIYYFCFVIGLHVNLINQIPNFTLNLSATAFAQFGPAQWAGAIAILSVVFSVILIFVYKAVKSGKWKMFLLGYGIAIVILVLNTYWVHKEYSMHFHHYFVTAAFLPLSRYKDPMAIATQGVLVGFCLQGVAVYGTAQDYTRKYGTEEYCNEFQGQYCSYLFKHH
eukprot:Nk52_evm4s252 gene=Nk52_evmTU4s252